MANLRRTLLTAAAALVAGCGPSYSIGRVYPATAALSVALTAVAPGVDLTLSEAGFLTVWRQHGNRIELLLADSVPRPRGTVRLTHLDLEPRTGPALRSSFQLHRPAPATSECITAGSSSRCLQYYTPSVLPRVAGPAPPADPPAAPVLLLTQTPIPTGQLKAALAFPLTAAEWPAHMAGDSAFAWLLARRLALPTTAKWGFTPLPAAIVPPGA